MVIRPDGDFRANATRIIRSQYSACRKKGYLVEHSVQDCTSKVSESLCLALERPTVTLEDGVLVSLMERRPASLGNWAVHAVSRGEATQQHKFTYK